jgi:hypothetical protein
MDLIGFNNFLFKIDTYKINNQLNIKAIEKKSQIEINYVAQLIINQILSDEIKKKNKKFFKRNSTVMYIKKNLVSRTRKAQKLMAHLKKAQARKPGATHAPRSYFFKKIS